MSELDSWPHGLALCKGQLRPCRLRLPGLGSDRELHAFAQFSATTCSTPHHSAAHALGPLLSPRPTRFTTVRFGFRPFPRGQVRDSSGETMHRDHKRASRTALIPLLPCTLDPSFPRVGPRFNLAVRVDNKRDPSQLQTNPNRSLSCRESLCGPL
jgi:hypothetical protein